MKHINKVSIAVLCLLIINVNGIKAQSRQDAIAFHNWKTTTKQINKYAAVEDDCLLKGGTGPYDPTDCLEKEILHMQQLKGLATDNPGIVKIINSELKLLADIQRNWNRLSNKEQQEKLRVYNLFLTHVKNNNGNYQKTFKQIATDSKRPKADRETALMLSDFFNTKGCTWRICCCPEGCDFCGNELLFKFIFGRQEKKN